MTQVYVFDLTLSRHLEETKDSNPDQIRAELNQIGKKWVFQGELSAPTEKNPEGFKHWQIRVSVFKKIREPEMWALKARFPLMQFAHVSITSNAVAKTFAGKDNDAFYITKADTRIEGEGPFTDKEKPLFIQKETRILMDQGLKPWQQQVRDSKEVYDARAINVIVDPTGGIGKSSLVAFLRQQRIAVCSPVMSDAQDYMALALTKEKLGMYVFDLPRAVPKKNMNAIFTAIESIKDGYAYDKRYKFRDETFERPVVWVFSNVLPPTECLSADRWRLWNVDPTGEVLVKYKDVQPDFVCPKRGAGAAGLLSADSMLLGDRPSKRMRNE